MSGRFERVNGELQALKPLLSSWQLTVTLGSSMEKANEALWDEVERTMTDYFAYPGVREWWETRKHWLTDEFRAVVEAIIANNPEQKLYAAYNLDN